MTWKELKKIAEKEFKCGLIYLDLIIYKGYFFWSDGRVEFEESEIKHKTPDEMYQMMSELKSSKE